MLSTIGELIKPYRNGLVGRGVSKTQLDVLATLEKHMGGWPLSALTNADAALFRLAQYERTRNVAPATLRRELGALVAVFNYARKTGRVPQATVPYIVLPPPSQPKQVWLDDAGIADLLHKAFHQPDRNLILFIRIALETGARKQAILDLTWDRVDFTANTVDFRVPGKRITKKRSAVVPMSQRLRQVLFDVWPLASGSRDRVVSQDITKAFYRFTHRVGLPHITPHVLRHTCATRLLRSGASIWQVAGILGDTPETITRVYGHHALDDLRRAIDKVA